jgi:hypothetical protein
MLEDMRKPILIVTLIVILLVLVAELGSIALLGGHSPSASAMGVSPTGKAIPALALLDGLVFFATLIITIALLVPERVQSNVQGIATFVVALLVLLACIRVIFVNFALVILMVSLLMAVPFGTIAYFIIWAHFDTGGAHAALSVIMLLKITFAVCLVLAQQRFLQNKGLVLIIVTSLVANLIIAFLHGLVPGFLVSITDGVAAIVMGILAAIWAVVYLIGGVISVIKVAV